MLTTENKIDSRIKQFCKCLVIGWIFDFDEMSQESRYLLESFNFKSLKIGIFKHLFS